MTPVESATRLEAMLELLAEAGEQTTCVLEGHCMRPVLEEGDKLIVRHGAGDLATGDLVIVRREARYLVQRVVRRWREAGEIRVSVQPDRGGRPARLPTTSDVVGKIIAAETARGRLDFESAAWRWANRAFAFRSRLAHHAARSGSPFWRWLRRARVMLLPQSAAPSRLLLRVARRLQPRADSPTVGVASERTGT